ncbi:MAG TPA: DUF92 domain-containing protein [Acidobacteriota bacterium]|nr:DUF92 domain-containing protein [Acidobacteriota bacterium]
MNGEAAAATADDRRAKRELGRRTVHIAMGGFAFLLAYLDWRQAALLALAALLFNLLVLPRIGGRALFRGEASRAGADRGIVLYPLSVLALILIFRQHLEVVAAAWALLAFGDGLAGAFGIVFGRLTGPLPWNRDKSWAGLVGFLLGGGPMAVALAGFVLRDAGPLPPFSLWAIGVVTVIVALAETAPLRTDDNLVVPLLGGALLYAATLVQPMNLAAAARTLFAPRLPWVVGGVVVCMLLALAARAVDLSGAAHGSLLALGLGVFGGWRLFAALAIFVLVGSAATRVRRREKEREGTAQERGGRRGARNVWANGGAALVFAFLSATAEPASVFMLAAVAALAAATADTLASEIGQAFGRRTVLITTFRPCPRGTDGGVSLAGTLAAAGGAALFAIGAYASRTTTARGALFIGLAAFAAPMVESVIGALFERRFLDNEVVNVANTLVGALGAVGLALWTI